MKYLYRLFQIVIALPIILAATLLTSLFTIIGSWMGMSHIFGYYPGKIWSQLICRVLFLPVRITGREHAPRNKSYVFVSNHQGMFDIFLIYGFLGHNFRWMMKESIRSIPFVGSACAVSGHIFVDRSNLQSIQTSIRKAQEALKKGKSMMVFPEGTRTLTGKMGRFKKGAFLLADELQLPIVPLTIDGSFEILPKGKCFIHRRCFTLTVHEPILPHGQGEENIKYLLKKSEEAIEASLPLCRRRTTP